MTEHLSGENSTPYDWTWVMNVANEMNDVMEAGMSAYIWWYLVRYYGPISDGTYLRKGEVTKKGYAMSNFARFIRPGYYRIESSTYPSIAAISITAYKDPVTSKIVIVAVNNSSSELEHVIRVSNNIDYNFKKYTTTETKDCKQEENLSTEGGLLKVVSEASSITTFISE